MNCRIRANLSLRKVRVLFQLHMTVIMCTVKQDLDNFVNKLRFQYVNLTLSEDNTTNSNDNNSEKLEIPPPKIVEKGSNFYLKSN